jgi:hypothetical protein
LARRSACAEKEDIAKKRLAIFLQHRRCIRKCGKDTAGESPQNYTKLTVELLKKEVEKRGLRTLKEIKRGRIYGSKSDLIQRLKDADCKDKCRLDGAKKCPPPLSKNECGDIMQPHYFDVNPKTGPKQAGKRLSKSLLKKQYAFYAEALWLYKKDKPPSCPPPPRNPRPGRRDQPSSRLHSILKYTGGIMGCDQARKPITKALSRELFLRFKNAENLLCARNPDGCKVKNKECYPGAGSACAHNKGGPGVSARHWQVMNATAQWDDSKDEWVIEHPRQECGKACKRKVCSNGLLHRCNEECKKEHSNPSALENCVDKCQ